MSILIESMEMPECCGYCPFEYKNYCMAKPSLRVESADRHPRCPLVPAPPHGRLIDADELRNDWLENGENAYVYYTNAFLWSLDDAPTVIPAELAEEGKT